MDSKVYPLRHEVDQLKKALEYWHAELEKGEPNVAKVKGSMKTWLNRWDEHGLGKHTKYQQSASGWF